jgi:transcriptional regulator with XRE-family HTH domain
MGQVKDTILIKKIAVTLKKLREQEGLTQLEVFYDTGLNIGRIESAKSNPSISTLAAICKYFKISLTEFFILIDKK